MVRAFQRQIVRLFQNLLRFDGKIVAVHARFARTQNYAELPLRWVPRRTTQNYFALFCVMFCVVLRFLAVGYLEC